MPNVPTVYLLGEAHLSLIPEYLQLGSVVVVAPDRDVLDRWREDQASTSPAEPVAQRVANLIVDVEGRRVLIGESPISMTDLEYRVLAALLARPGRAWSFKDLHKVGWGESLELPCDDQTVRALVQRLRNKLRIAGSEVHIDAVRSFGFRSSASGCDAGDRLSLTGAPFPAEESAQEPAVSSA